MSIVNKLEQLKADAQNNIQLRTSLINASKQNDPMKTFL